MAYLKNPESLDEPQNFQGPVNWRKNLKPLVTNVMMESNSKADQDDKTENSASIDRTQQHKDGKDPKRLGKECFEESKIREKLKSMPAGEKKGKGPLVAKHLASPVTLSPQAKSAITRTGSFQENATVNCLRKNAILRSGSFHETPFTRNVVNMRPLSPGIPRRRISPSNSFSRGNLASGRRTPSPNTLVDAGDTAKKRVDKVLRARLYLLQQMGPNSFLICGDNPDQKFKVIIGPQTCSCCRPHCVHLLFVMLRVFQVKENDPLLWSKPLKNYEVENLFRAYLARRTLRIKSPAKKAAAAVAKPSSPPPSPSSPDSAASANGDAGSRSEEETCPICLMDLMDGETTVACEGGCQNKLHLHCISVWFQLCRRQHDTLICPLCRAIWKGPVEDIEIEQTSATSTPEPDAPPNTRVSSPQPVNSGTENLLPRPEPIPPELTSVSQPWLECLSEDLVACLVSRNWSVRETGLRHLSREVIAALLPTVGDGRPGVVVSNERQQIAQKTLECCCSILKLTCSDPVYKVLVASLRALRSVLSYVPCRDATMQVRLQRLLKPVIDAILLKCADGNRRTSQLSLSTLLEFAKGQEGELAVGREITNAGTEGIGGVKYILSCITEDYDLANVQWQWLLGRILTIDKLIEEFQHEFLLEIPENFEDSEAGCYDEIPSYQNVMAVLKFALKAVDHSHVRIGKTARRVFIRTSRFVVHVPHLFKRVESMLNCLELGLQNRMKRRLVLIASEFQNNISDDIEEDHMYSDLMAPRSSPATTPDLPSCHSTPFTSPRNTIIINNYVADRVVVVRPDGQHGFTKVPSSPETRSESPAGSNLGGIPKVRKNKPPASLQPPVSPKNLIHWKSAFSVATNESEHLLVPQPPPELSASDEETPVPHAAAMTSGHDESIVCETENEKEDEESMEKACKETNEKDFKSAYTRSDTTDSGIQEEIPGPAVRTSIHFSDDFLVTSHIGANGEVTTITSQSKTEDRNTVTVSNSELNANLKWATVLQNSYKNKAMAPLPPDPKALSPLPPLPVVQVSNADGQVIGNPGVIDSPDEPFPRDLNNYGENLDVVDEGYKVENERSLRFLCDPSYPGQLKRKAIYCSCGGNDGCVDCQQMLRSMLAESSIEYETYDSQADLDDDEESHELQFTDEELLDDHLSSCTTRSSSTTSSVTGRQSCLLERREYLETNLDDLAEDGPPDVCHRPCETSSSPIPSTSGIQYKRKISTNNKTQDSGMATEDLSDLTLSPSTPEYGLVSFKSEVAVLSPRDEEEAECHCKEEVELEEAVALAKAMEISEKQEELPVIPGLRGCRRDSNDDEEKTIVIQVQNENGSGDGQAPRQYLENTHWVRGLMIGTGAFSTCYHARDVQTGVLMAVKQISFCRNSKSEQQKVIDAVRDEIQMMARLNHPYVVRILGATQQGCHFNMFVEWMPGGSVAKLLESFGAFSEPVITSYTQQILMGLIYLHENHMLHRDLKGANILVDSTGKKIRIGDFGAAARLVSHNTGVGEFQGQLLGTIAFMAPEVLRGENYGRSCDIWSVGCCMIEMSTTKPPWGASDLSNHLKLIFMIASSKDPPPIPDRLSPAVKDLLLRCLEVNREHRPSAKELLCHPLFTRYKAK